MELADAGRFLTAERELLLKLNLSWTKYFPACSSQPWQLDGVVSDLLGRGYGKEQLLPIENKTVVTNPHKGARNNLWMPILERNGLDFIALPEVEWEVYRFQSDLLKLNEIFPEGIEIPKIFVGRDILHLPTVKTHGHSTTTGAIKNAFGGLLKEVRHYAHKYIHEVLVDLLLMQRELHPRVFAVMDGTVCGNGAGPRTMDPVEGDLVLASADSVAIDAVAAKIMGFDPWSIDYLRWATERGLGEARIENMEIVGEDIGEINFNFKTKRSFVIWGDQMLRKGPLRFLEKIALHSPLVVWAPAASNIYHDFFWYPTVGRGKINKFKSTKWGNLWESYRNPG
ncbi:MAG: DUF362 domain-containing protein [Candidatus Krumholzibacteriota bacterium]|nr:DUF362 domain-containing protein [Candidatus Krumholzibacteriota bacterium]